MNTCTTCNRDLVAGELCHRIACIWHLVAGAAVELDIFTMPGSTQSGPAVIRAQVMNTHDRLPGGASSSETGVRSARMEACEDITCPEWLDGFRHDHPVPVDPTGDAAMRPSKSEADLGALQTAVDAFVAAVGHLSALSHSRGAPRTWDEAVTDAVLLDDMDAIDTLEMSGQKPRRWVLKAGDAIHDIEQIRDRHCPRDASDHERTWTDGLAPGECCRVCIKLGLLVSRRNGTKELCQSCMRLRNKCAEVNGVERDEVPNPPDALVAELRRINNPGGPADLAERSRWYQRVGYELAESRRVAG